MLLCRYRNSNVFQAYLPCRDGPHAVKINLVLWNSNYYRYLGKCVIALEDSLEFRQVYLRYQDLPYCNVTFEIDGSAITENGFTCCDTYPSEFTENRLTLTDANSLCVKTYTERQGDSHFALALGQCFGPDWVHFINNPSSQVDENELIPRGPDRARFTADVPSRGDLSGRLWVSYFPVSTWIVRIYRIVWEKSKIGVRIEVFWQDSSFHYSLGWKALEIEASVFHVLHMDHYHDYI